MFFWYWDTLSCAAQDRKPKLCGWSEAGSCTKLRRAACKPGTSAGHEKDCQWSCITLFLEGGRKNLALSWYSVFASDYIIFRYTWTKGSARQSSGFSPQLNAAVQDEIVATLAFRLSRKGDFSAVCWRGRNLLELHSRLIVSSVDKGLWSSDMQAGACRSNDSPCRDQAVCVCTPLHQAGIAPALVPSCSAPKVKFSSIMQHFNGLWISF